VFSDLNDGIALGADAARTALSCTRATSSVEQLTEVDATTGVETGLNVPLSDVVDGLSAGADRVGVFSGKGKLAVDVAGTVHVIDIATGRSRSRRTPRTCSAPSAARAGRCGACSRRSAARTTSYTSPTTPRSCASV